MAVAAAEEVAVRSWCNMACGGFTDPPSVLFASGGAGRRSRTGTFSLPGAAGADGIITVVPEPSAWVMLAIGVGGLLGPFARKPRP